MWALLFSLLCAPSLQEQVQELHENATDVMDIFQVDFSHTGQPLAVFCSVLIISFLKPLFARFRSFPNSVLLLGFGIAVAYALSFVFEDEIYLRPQLFFVMLLPQIVLEAGYFMRNKDFFHNLGTICTYAVVGTVLNTTLLALLLHYCNEWGFFGLPPGMELTFLHCVIFSTLICAVDPVAVLCVFEDIHVNELLHICVFGESLINDAVVIVLYKTVNSMLIAGPPLPPTMYAQAVASFFTVSFGGIVIGIVGGLITAFAMKCMATTREAQPLVMFFMPFVFYLVTDTFHFSGILSIVIQGILIKNYIRGNVSEEMHFVIEYMYKTASSYSESLIFVFLGASVVSSNHVWNFPFIAVTIIGCFFFRFLCIGLLTVFVNKMRLDEDQISIKDQFIMAYGGIRGAVCYGLVVTIDEDLIGAKEMLVTTTLCVIVFTTVFQKMSSIKGSTIKCLVEKLDVKRSKGYLKSPSEKKKKVIDHLQTQVNKHVIEFVENLTKIHSDNVFYRCMLDLDRNYLQKLLVYQPKTKAEDIVEFHKEIEMAEYIERGGSFAGFPTQNSTMDLAGSKSFCAGCNLNQLSVVTRPSALPSAPRPTLPPQKSPLPRNVSVTGILEHALEQKEEQARQIQRNKRRSTYSRHLLPDSPSPFTFDRADMDTSFDEELNYRTVPCSKAQSVRIGVKNFHYSLKDKEAAARSPGRAFSSRSPENRNRMAPVLKHVGKRNLEPSRPSFQVTEEDERPAAARGRNERKVHGERKTFTVGEDVKLLPIFEKDGK